jgi:pSer/pThr/pTyr-binding forkhead associated (FHA) protein
VSHVYCPECGFQNPEAANYCSKCGARLIPEAPGEATETFTAEDIAGDPAGGQERSGFRGPALVVRSGGGRAGETFRPEGQRTRIGRSPDCDVFLDDVTVSRDHALLVKRGGDHYLDDLGSLNGTYVNRHRIESHRLEDGDELQVGKFKLTFLSQ